jgi:polyferredoxin
MKYKIAILRALTIMFFFFSVAAIVSTVKENPWYLILFGSIGTFAGLTEFAIAVYPDKAQIIRRIVLLSLGTALVTLALVIAVNFQFSQVCFDIYTSIVTGALIQFIVARLIIPLLFGNIFCSRACWDSAVFEITDKQNQKAPTDDSKLTAWLLAASIIISVFIVSFYYIPKSGTPAMRYIFISENLLIIILGTTLSRIYGRRFYCRKLCPFIAVSGIFSRFALFKITPQNINRCTSCKQCTNKCPMGIDVMQYVKENRRINHKNCIMCEQCVSVCPQNCLQMNFKKTSPISHTKKE